MLLLVVNKTIKAQIFSTSLRDSELITPNVGSRVIKVGKAAFSLLLFPPDLVSTPHAEVVQETRTSGLPSNQNCRAWLPLTVDQVAR